MFVFPLTDELSFLVLLPRVVYRVTHSIIYCAILG